MSLGLLALCAIAVLVGATAQRVTGLGFALVCSPFLVMALGPIEGVVIANLCGLTSGLLSLTSTWRQVAWRRTLRLGVATLIGFAPGMVVIRLVPLDWLAVLVASIVLIALLITMTAKPGNARDSWHLGVVSGVSSGFMTVTASVGGPPLAIYGRLTGWDHREFAAGMQAMSPFLLVPVLTAPSFPSFPLLGWVMLATALIAGVLLGTRLAPRISGRLAGNLVMGIAWVGTLVALGRALMTLSV